MEMAQSGGHQNPGGRGGGGGTETKRPGDDLHSRRKRQPALPPEGGWRGTQYDPIRAKKARHAAIYRRPSKAAADQLMSGQTQVLVFPNAFPNQGGLPIQVDGQTIGGIAASGAASEVDEAIAQTAIDALLKK